VERWEDSNSLQQVTVLKTGRDSTKASPAELISMKSGLQEEETASPEQAAAPSVALNLIPAKAGVNKEALYD
jgi:hypothetical protein